MILKSMIKVGLILAAEVYRRELLSDGQLSDLLKLDRIELRRLLDEIDREGEEANGAIKLSI